MTHTQKKTSFKKSFPRSPVLSFLSPLSPSTLLLLLLRPHDPLLKPFLRRGPPQHLGVHRQPRRHREAPVVPDLPVQVEVALRDEHLVLAPRRPGAAAAVGRRDVARAVERPHVPVGLLPVPRGERVGEDLRADAVDLGREHRVRDRGVAPLDRPEGLGEGPDCRDGVEDDLGAVQGEGLPVERVVAAVADVDGDPGEAEVEDPGKKRFLKKKKGFQSF